MADPLQVPKPQAGVIGQEESPQEQNQLSAGGRVAHELFPGYDAGHGQGQGFFAGGSRSSQRPV